MSELVASRLFLSCDLVGSTAFKQKNQPDDWLRVFINFYREFPAYLEKHLAGTNLHPQLWKAIGDELIFVTDVNSEETIWNIVDAWIKSMDEYETALLTGGALGLATKGGAFLATFPTPNRTVPIVTPNGTSDDYLGPSIDTGFRVMNNCSERHFTLSVEVAWALAVHWEEKQVNHKALRLVSVPVMKGVWQGRAYPLFALDRQATDKVNKALSAIQKNDAVETEKVAALARACVASSDWPALIYLRNATSEELRDPEVADKLKAAADSLAEEALTSDQETPVPATLPTSGSRTVPID